VPILGVIGPKEKVQGVKDVPPCLAERRGGALSQGKKVVNEDVNISKGLACGGLRQRGVRVSGCRVSGLRRPCEALPRVSWREVGHWPRVVDEAGGGFGAGAEKGGRLCESHGEGEVETDVRFRVARMGRNNEGELQKVLKAQPDPHVCVGEVNFGHVDRAMAGFGVYDGVEETMEGAAELHGLGRGLLLHGAIGATPRVVVDEAVSTAGLGDAAGRAKPEAREVSGLAPREEANVPIQDLLGEFRADKAGGMNGGAVAAVGNGGREILGWGVRSEEHGSAPSTKLVDEGSSGVRTRRQESQLVSTRGGAADLLE
jgi:hypothetical protein